jgi:hypothetical protein
MGCPLQSEHFQPYPVSLCLLVIIKPPLFFALSVYAGADPGFQVRGAHLKKLRRAKGGAKIVGVFRVKNHDFTPTNLIFSNFRGARAGCPPPPPAWIRPWYAPDLSSLRECYMQQIILCYIYSAHSTFTF